MSGSLNLNVRSGWLTAELSNQSKAIVCIHNFVQRNEWFCLRRCWYCCLVVCLCFMITVFVSGWQFENFSCTVLSRPDPFKISDQTNSFWQFCIPFHEPSRQWMGRWKICYVSLTWSQNLEKKNVSDVSL